MDAGEASKLQARLPAAQPRREPLGAPRRQPVAPRAAALAPGVGGGHRPPGRLGPAPPADLLFLFLPLVICSSPCGGSPPPRPHASCSRRSAHRAPGGGRAGPGGEGKDSCAARPPPPSGDALRRRVAAIRRRLQQPAGAHHPPALPRALPPFLVHQERDDAGGRRWQGLLLRRQHRRRRAGVARRLPPVQRLLLRAVLRGRSSGQELEEAEAAEDSCGGGRVLERLRAKLGRVQRRARQGHRRGTGQLVKGMFMCSEAYASQVQRGADLFRPQAAGGASNRFGTTSQASTKRGAVNTSLKRVRKTPELVGALPLVPPVRRRAGAPWRAELRLRRPPVELAQLRLVVPAAEHGGRRRGHQRRQIRGRELLQDGLLRRQRHRQRQGCRRHGGGGRGGLPVLEQRPDAEIATGILGFPSWSRAASRPRLPVLVPERPRRPSRPGAAWSTYPDGKAEQGGGGCRATWSATTHDATRARMGWMGNHGTHYWRGNWRPSRDGGLEGRFGGLCKMEVHLKVLLELHFFSKPLNFGVEARIEALLELLLPREMETDGPPSVVLCWPFGAKKEGCSSFFSPLRFQAVTFTPTKATMGNL